MPVQPFVFDEYPSLKTGDVPDSDQKSVFPEDVLSLPWTLDPEFSWMDYNCWVEITLDPGMTFHKPLPQRAWAADDLGTVAIDDPRMDASVQGANINSNCTADDFVQRGATSTYTFVLRGTATRVGYQVPIPKILQVGGQTAYPDTPQWGFNRLVGNLSGIPVWFAAWQKQYFLPKSPSGSSVQAPVPFNPALKIRPDAQLPETVSIARALQDPRATTQSTLRSVPPSFFTRKPQ